MAKKKEYYEELPTKVCPRCGELSMEDAEVCDSCGFSFVETDEPGGTAEETQDINALFDALESEGETLPEEQIPGQINVAEVLDETLESEPEPPVEQPNYSDEDPFEEPPEEPIEEYIESENLCPNCGAQLDEDATFCPVCGEQIGEGEEPNNTLLEGLADGFTLVEKGKIDYSKAVFGEETIVRKVGDKYEAITYPKEDAVKVIEADDKETEMLKADYILRKGEGLTTRNLVDAGAVLRDSAEYLEKYYGNSDIDDIYGSGLTDYASIKGIKDDILDIELPVDTMQILNELGAKAQTDLAGIMKRYEIDDLTPTSAKLIVDSDRTEETMRDIVVREKTMQSIVSDYISRVLDR